MALFLSLGEMAIGGAQIADALSNGPNDKLHDFSTIPGLTLGLSQGNAAKYAPLIDGLSGFATGEIGGATKGTENIKSLIEKPTSVLKEGGKIDAALDIKGVYDGENKHLTKNEII